jgi:5-bromo-4-chloroindolyl phosphate hydrolysis protein
LASTELKLIKEQQELASTELKLIKEQQELASAELKSITLLLVSVKGLAERIQRNPLVRIGRLIERIFTWNR